MKSFVWFEPNTSNYRDPLISIVVGGVIKYLIGGQFFDFIGHWLIVIGAVNMMYYVQRDRISKLPTLVVFILAISLSLVAQILFLQIFDGFSPIFG